MDYREITQLDLPIAVAIISCGAEWRVEEANEEFADVLGYTEKELRENSPRKMVCQEDYDGLIKTLEHAVQTRENEKLQLRIVRPDGKKRWVEMRCSVLAHYDVKPYVVLFLWDIDEEKKREEHQELLNQKYELMEQLSMEYPFDLDVENWTMLRSYRLMDLRGEYDYSDQYFPVDEEVLTLCPPDQELFLNAMREAAREEKTGSIDTRFNIHTDKEMPKYLWFRTYYKSIADRQGHITRIIGRSFNIDEDKNLQEEVRRDPLTKLLNKIEIQRETDAFLEGAEGGTHVLFLIDIDNFKGINDNFGHTFGDTVIVDIAEIIRSLFRNNDLTGRVGGDEFLVLMKNTTLEKAKERAKNLGEALCKIYTGGSLHYRISASIGLAACSGGDGNTYSSLFEKADHAMYRTKQGGKNGYEIAGAKDVGMLSNGIKKIERRENMSVEDREFLAFSISLMAHAKNIDGSLNMLLNRITDRYQLDLVMVFEDSTDNDGMVMTNYFGKRYSFYGKSVFPKKSPALKDLQPGDYKVIKNTQSNFAVGLGNYLKTMDAHNENTPFSAVVGKFEYVGGCTGEVVYVSLDEERQWQPGELEIFQELTRMMAIFVSLRYRAAESREQISSIREKDQLTGLYNQDAFRKVASGILEHPEEGKVYAVEYMDINNFGYINENYGYKVGDNVLKMFAQDVSEQSYFRAGCRLYSDFFLILIADTDGERLVDHLHSRNKRFSNMQNHRYPNSGMGVSAGVYILEDTKMDVDQAIENANLAWKNAKNTGKRDIILYDPSLRSKRAEEQKIIGEFFEALYRDDFQMYLQPKFILGDRSVYGAEALARWKRPDGKILPPGVFIDSLEKIGYITELDFYIYEEVLKTLEKWDKQHRRKIVISTNFSGRHFESDGEEFLNRIQHVLSKYSVRPEYIEIEVTEGVLVKNVAVLEKCMNRLHEMGFRVAIDDFGTGYSSLSVLADMPADVIKIDKSFINKGMTEQKKNLLYEIGRMVKILHKDIIIEGVETEEQEQFLREGGFTCGQGYLCNCPVPIGDFEKMYL